MKGQVEKKKIEEVLSKLDGLFYFLKISFLIGVIKYEIDVSVQSVSVESWEDRATVHACLNLTGFTIEFVGSG